MPNPLRKPEPSRPVQPTVYWTESDKQFAALCWIRLDELPTELPGGDEIDLEGVPRG